jgi:mannose-6-phosphate isomerase-like protein (cupin superfamily)
MEQAPTLFASGEGTTYQMGQIRMTFKPTFGGTYGLCETLSDGPAGSGSGLHRHDWDEWHVIIEGTYECTVGSDVRTVGPGGMMFAPAGTPHAIKKLNDGTARQLGIMSPPGQFEAFVAEVSASRVESGSASRQGGEGFREIAARNGIEFIDS